MSFPFTEPTPEEIAEHKRQRDEYHARLQDNTHRVKHFIDSLDKEGLESLGMLLLNLNDTDRVMYYQGRVQGSLEIKYGKCPCGAYHDAEFAGLTEVSKIDVDEFINLCNKYGVEAGESGSDVVVCLSCGQRYPNLADRMLREPGIDGCHGCQHKSAHG